MKIKLLCIVFGVIIISCSSPQKIDKKTTKDFNYENFSKKKIYMFPIINLTKEIELSKIDYIPKKVFSSKRKYLSIYDAYETLKLLKENNIYEYFEELKNQYPINLLTENKPIEPELIKKLSSVLKNNYIVFTSFYFYKIDEDTKLRKKETEYAYKSSLSGNLMIYDLETGLPVFNADHHIDYKNETSCRNYSESMKSKGNTAGNIVGNIAFEIAGACMRQCIGQYIEKCITGCITDIFSNLYLSIVAPSTSTMAKNFFEEIADNMPTEIKK